MQHFILRCKTSDIINNLASWYCK